ncbi:MAG: hypothetical protein WAU32_04250 [Thermoanaerobaculia bacterium]
MRLAVRIAVAGIALAALLLAGYAATAKWLLSGPKLRSLINSDPESSLLDWDEAWSIWPGRIRVRNLRIRGSDRNVQYIIVLKEARVRYSALALASRRFRVTAVDGAGLSFRLRQKLTREELRTTAVDLLPPVPGFDDPPLREEKPPAPPVEGNPWTLVIRGIAIERLEEIWVDAWRYEGAASVRGEFLLRSGQRASVGPASITFPGGLLRLGKAAALTKVDGKLEATFDEWDPRVVQGNAVWKEVTGQARVAGPTESIAFLNHFLRASKEPRLSGGAGTLSAEGSIAHGLARGDVVLEARKARMERAGRTIVGDTAARLHVPEGNLETGRLVISGSRLELTDARVTGSEAAPGWWGKFLARWGVLDRGLSARVELECRDARPLFFAFGVQLPKWAQEILKLEGLRGSARVTLAPSLTVVRNLEVKGGKFVILGDYEARKGIPSGAFLIDTGSLNVAVEIGGGMPHLRLINAKPWFEERRAAQARPAE